MDMAEMLWVAKGLQGLTLVSCTLHSHHFGTLLAQHPGAINSTLFWRQFIAAQFYEARVHGKLSSCNSLGASTALISGRGNSTITL